MRPMLTLRDQLALERTLLANERTGLAWLRTAITLVIAGVTLFHLTDRWLSWLGLALVPTGIVLGGVGRARYVASRARIVDQCAEPPRIEEEE